MATKAEITQMLALIKASREEIDAAMAAMSEAREVMRDAYALIDAMADELAERAES